MVKVHGPLTSSKIAIGDRSLKGLLSEENPVTCYTNDDGFGQYLMSVLLKFRRRTFLEGRVGTCFNLLLGCQKCCVLRK